jgi:WD40 repeat protein
MKSRRYDMGAMAWSPDSKTLATTSELWDVETGSRLLSPEFSTVIGWSADGSRVAGNRGVWDLALNKQLIAGPQSRPSSFWALWAPDSRRIATFDSNTVMIWDATTGQRLQAFAVNQAIEWLAWSPDGAHVAVAQTNTATIHDAATGQLLKPMPEGPWVRVAWSADGRTLASGGLRLPISIWDVEKGIRLHTIPSQGFDDILLRFAPAMDGRLAYRDLNSKLQFFDPAKGEVVTPNPAAKPIPTMGFAWAPDAQHFATYEGKNAPIQVYEASNGTRLSAVEHPGECRSGPIWLAESEIGCVDVDNIARFHDVKTGAVLRSFPVISSAVTFSPNLKWYADPIYGAILLSDVATGRRLGALVTLGNGRYVTVGPEGHYQGSRGVENEILYIVETEKGQKVLTPQEFQDQYGWKNDPARARLAAD